MILVNTLENFDIRTYTLDTDLPFEVTMIMFSELTETQINELANEHLKLAISNFGILLTDHGMTMESIGFTVLEDSLQ